MVEVGRPSPLQQKSEADAIRKRVAQNGSGKIRIRALTSGSGFVFFLMQYFIVFLL